MGAPSAVSEIAAIGATVIHGATTTLTSTSTSTIYNRLLLQAVFTYGLSPVLYTQAAIHAAVLSPTGSQLEPTRTVRGVWSCA